MSRAAPVSPIEAPIARYSAEGELRRSESVFRVSGTIEETPSHWQGTLSIGGDRAEYVGRRLGDRLWLISHHVDAAGPYHFFDLARGSDAPGFDGCVSGHYDRWSAERLEQLSLDRDQALAWLQIYGPRTSRSLSDRRPNVGLYIERQPLVFPSIAPDAAHPAVEQR